ncbi:hypothetical protein FIU82_01790 [Pseudoalteromonas sp. THAF3]|uniref:beta family protein n=1 Tax=unclassified Pseudoalteromonas TaxID=194690 RepID=UPI0012682B80|nr:MULTISPECIES: beta family protein [unclassified Pseudoalteromonas]MCG7566561.1 beta family protein [Pseudoalteromonas sp. CnMc7-15]QFU03749.1 hypothetical protein FIU82_01790 [Pseudoalteromonas sp. THAF3]
MDYHYYPVLRIQRGECDAISKLPIDVAGGVNPIWEIPPIPKLSRKDGGGDKYSVEEHIRLCLEKLIPAMSGDRVLRLDAIMFDQYIVTEDGEELHSLDCIAALAKEANINFVPVVTLESSRDYIEAANRHSGHGICLRLDVSNLNSDAIVEACEELYECISTVFEDTDLLLDIKTVSFENKGALKERLVLALMQLNGLTAWRSLSMASTSYLASMSGIEKDKVITRPMLEFELWKELMRIAGLPRLPAYGDYALAPAELDYSTPVEFMNPAATIRYSDENHWIFVKGEQVKGKGGIKGPGWGQTQRLCQILVESPFYKQYGPEFSPGDRYIADRATNDVRCGAGFTWKDVGINHHASVIARYLSNLNAL